MDAPMRFSRHGRLVGLAVFALLLIVAVQFSTVTYFPKTPCDPTRMSDSEIAAARGISMEMLQLMREHRDVYPAELCGMSESALARAIDKSINPKPDHPGEAVAFRALQQKDENGSIPPDGLIQAARQVSSMRFAAPSGGTIANSRWTWLGPGNIGGRIRTILIDPTSTNTMWVGSVSGGIWKSINGGTSWSVVDDFMANLAVSTLVMQPNNSNSMYAGTGEGFYNADSIQGAGIFKSTDHGTTWTQLASTNNSDFYYVNRLAISPDSSTILAVTGSNNIPSGIWRSINDGSTWTKVSTDGYVKDVQFDPTNSSKAIAAGSYGRAYYSIDGGASWTPATGLPSLGWLGRVEVAYAPSNPSIVYAGVNQSGGQLWSSTNGGQSYSLVNTGTSYMGSQGWYDNVIWVDPTNANTLVVGGIDLYRSINGGANLTKISRWDLSPNSAHADHHAIVNHPGYDGSTNKTVFFGNDGGIYKATDVSTVGSNSPLYTSGWTELNNNLGITQFYGAAGNVSSGVIVGGTQDNGSLTFNGGTETWSTMYGGDGGFAASDPTNSNYFYGEYVYANVYRSTNGGVSSTNDDYIMGARYTLTGWVCKSAPYVITDACNNSQALFISPFILDPNNVNRMLVGANSLWRTNDAKTANTTTTGPSWSTIKSPAGSYISAIAVAPGNSDLIWVGHNSPGNVYKTTNGTAVSPIWNQMDNNPTALPNRYVNRITIDPSNTNVVYITFGGYSSGNVWRTTDGGSTWNQRSGTGGTALPAAPVRSLVIHPSHPNWLYVGTEVGVFASDDAGASWFLPQGGPANVSVDELFWMGTKLIAVTFGRGLFSTIPGYYLNLPLILK